jgi:serine/threonine protein kinase
VAPTPDRWQQIEVLYHAALERGRGVLDDADPELRREVEQLLAVEPTGEGLLDQPAAALLAEAVTMELKPGVRLGPYQIESLIGQGGMGKVYRARDTRLGRTVAIKTSSARFIQRFKSEARAIAALNHPHICHLYHVGPDYLVMEYVEGTPLKGPFPMDEA